MLLHNEKGFAMPLALMVMLVVTLLGTALWQYSYTDTIQVDRSVKKTQAHYIARSAADATAEYIEKNTNEVQTLLDATSSNPGTGSLGNGEFDVQVLGSVDGLITIKSIGYVDSKRIKDTVTLTMKRLSNSEIFDRAIYSVNDLDITNMRVTGDVESKGSIIPEDYDGGGRYEHSERDFPPPVFPHPDLPAWNPIVESWGENVILANGSKEPDPYWVEPFDIAGEYEFNRIEISNQRKLRFDTTGYDKLTIVVDTLIAEGDVEIYGGGKVELYIKGYARFHTPLVVNDEDSSDLFIYLAPASKLELQANGEINGFIYGPTATVLVQSDNSTINGGIIANVVIKNDSSNTPNGEVNFEPILDDEMTPWITMYERLYWND